MKIPESVRIGGVEYAISYVENLQYGNQLAYGYIDYDNCKIELSATDSIGHQKRCQTLLHEILPYWVSVHLCRHTHAQPYVKTQRNDRQHEYDRNATRQDESVLMIWDMNAEELLAIANKRLCFLAAEETRKVVENMRLLVNEKCPEFKDYLVPMCEYAGCHEMKPCGRKL